MALYYFFSNNQAMINRSSSTVVGTTLGGTFNPAEGVDSSILIPAATGPSPLTWQRVGMPIAMGGSPSITAKHFGHFVLNTTTNNTPTSSTVPFIEIVNLLGVVVFRISVTSTAAQCQFWNGSALTNVGPTFLATSTGLNDYDYDFTPGASGSFTLRINGGSVPIISVSGFNVAVDNVAEVRVNNHTQAAAYFSQGILSDTDMRGAKCGSFRPTGNGFHTDGTGTFSDVNGVVTDDTTGIGLTVSGNRKSFTKASFTPTGMVIDAVSVNIKAGVSGGTIANARPIVRRAAVTTPGANYSPSPSLGLQQTMLPMYLDPSTGLAWTVTNWNASELGVEART